MRFEGGGVGGEGRGEDTRISNKGDTPDPGIGYLIPHPTHLTLAHIVSPTQT